MGQETPPTGRQLLRNSLSGLMGSRVSSIPASTSLQAQTYGSQFSCRLPLTWVLPADLPSQGHFRPWRVLLDQALQLGLGPGAYHHLLVVDKVPHRLTTAIIISRAAGRECPSGGDLSPAASATASRAAVREGHSAKATWSHSTSRHAATAVANVPCCPLDTASAGLQTLPRSSKHHACRW